MTGESNDSNAVFRFFTKEAHLKWGHVLLIVGVGIALAGFYGWNVHDSVEETAARLVNEKLADEKRELTKLMGQAKAELARLKPHGDTINAVSLKLVAVTESQGALANQRDKDVKRIRQIMIEYKKINVAIVPSLELAPKTTVNGSLARINEELKGWKDDE